MKVLLTGAAGFIGNHLAYRLTKDGFDVVGADNVNAYYSVALKRARLARLSADPRFSFHEIDVADETAFDALCRTTKADVIIHLAAQAGVRYSLENPFAYNHSNLRGHLSVLEAARRTPPRHLLYASSSSVYGANVKTPFCETDRVDEPVSLYGATKKANEVMSTAYGRLYQLPLTGFRFFTVYGPWGRPDMAYWIFTEKMRKGEPIDVFNNGEMARDFTYVDDIVDGLVAAIDQPPSAEDQFHRLFNLGNDTPEPLMKLISLLEENLGVKAIKNFKGMQKGDVQRTWADISKARGILSYNPKTSLEEGIRRTISWRTSTDMVF